tara:strand:- start:1012 stop:1587 length:576 start_codon:yes stop_codon:yes gene_type:complete
MTTKAWYGDGVKLLNNVVGGKLKDPISLEEINKQPGGSVVFNNYAFNMDTIYSLFRNIVDDNINEINISNQDFDEFLGGVEDNGIYDAFRFMKIWDYKDPVDPRRNTMNPKFLEGLEKIYLLYGGGSALGANHTYNTRQLAWDGVEPTKYEFKDEVASMKKRKRKGNKTKKRRSKKHTKRKKKQRRKSKMR